MPICGKCGEVQTVDEIRRCYSALPHSNVLTDEFDQGQVEKRGSNFYLREQNQYLYNQHQADLAYEEAHPLVQNFPPSLRVVRKELTRATYKDRGHIKASGGRWDPKKRCWYVEGDVPDRLKKFLDMDDPDRIIRSKPKPPPVRTAEDDELDAPIRQGAALIKRQGGGLDFGKLLEDSKAGLISKDKPGGEAFFEEDEPQKGVETKHDFSPVGDGYYRKDGIIWKVVRNQADTAFYAKHYVIDFEKRDATKDALDAAREAGDTKTVALLGRKTMGTWEYVPGMYQALRNSDKLSVEEAKKWGALYGICCRCGRMLTNEDSIEAGIGPICASKF